ncbi:hypothetical protein ABID56_001450 [Alkalibacillus flavidus]|uniref:Uncharacterized protein n=1 Tax=Alkalibacillus flavidus TaxID=546021 RepID=A0ABV2KXE6_9BACI
MGYILPVDQHQYQRYQQRVTSENRVPYMVERPFGAELDTQRKQSFEYAEDRKQMSKRYQNKPEQDQEQQQSAEQAETMQLYMPENVQHPTNIKNFKELTGKGRFFSESV